MKRLCDHDAFGHPAYDGAVSNAVRQARENPQGEYALYYDGEVVFVRNVRAPRPENSKLILIAQRWNDRMVQLRFDGARSEWVKI